MSKRKALRKIFKFLVPHWLSAGEGELVLFSLAIIKDFYLERLRQGTDARFPTRSHASALALTGKDRGIIRGKDEADACYAVRLVEWRYPRGHRIRGGAYALLNQASAYFGGDLFSATIDVSGNLNERLADGTETTTHSTAWDWDDTGKSPNWARFWLRLDLADIGVVAWPDFGDPDLWGGDLCIAGTTIGFDGISSDDADAIRGLITADRSWKPAGTRAEWVYTDLSGAPVSPDGTWLNWSKNTAGRQVATRPDSARFWSLSPAINNNYAGDATNFPSEIDMPDGTTYTPSEVYSASITLPDGTTYTGNPAAFKSSIQLVDDGDLPS